MDHGTKAFKWLDVLSASGPMGLKWGERVWDLRLSLFLEPLSCDGLLPGLRGVICTLQGKRSRWLCLPHSTLLSQDQLLDVCISPCIRIRFRKKQNDHVCTECMDRKSALLQHIPWLLSGFVLFLRWWPQLRLGDFHGPRWCCLKGNEVPSNLW